MSPKNVQVLSRFAQAWQRGDFAAALSVLDENVEWHDQAAIPGAEVHRGREAVRRHFEQWLNAWKEIDYTPEEVLDRGDRVVVVVRRRGKGARSGAEVDDRVVYVYTVSGDKIVRFEAFTDKADALEAVELAEQAMSQDNVELAQQAYDAVNRRDLGAFLALMDPDVEAVPRMAAMEGVYHAHEGIRRWWKGLFDVFPDFGIEVVEVRDLGDLTIAPLHFRGHGAGSDTPFDDAIWQLGRWRHGKCIWWRVYGTEAEALEAAGLRE